MTRTFRLMIAASLMVAGRAAAQDKGGNVDVQVSPAVVKRVDDYMMYQTSLPGRIYGINLKYQGLIPMAAKVPNPLQLINPLAPREYGDGYQNVIFDPATKRQEGLKVFEIRF
jgi:hypothetical protein